MPRHEVEVTGLCDRGAEGMFLIPPQGKGRGSTRGEPRVVWRLRMHHPFVLTRKKRAKGSSRWVGGGGLSSHLPVVYPVSRPAFAMAVLKPRAAAKVSIRV